MMLPFTTAALLAIAAFQTNHTPIRDQRGNDKLVNTKAVASFTGTLKSADKKWLVLAVDNGESLRMFVTGKTKFLRDGKSAKPADFHEGEAVVVDAERDIRLNMLAVKVELPTKNPVEAK